MSQSEEKKVFVPCYLGLIYSYQIPRKKKEISEIKKNNPNIGLCESHSMAIEKWNKENKKTTECPLYKKRYIEKTVRFVNTLSNAEEDPNIKIGHIFYQFEREHKIENYDLMIIYRMFVDFLKLNDIVGSQSHQIYFYKILDKANKMEILDSFIESLIVDAKTDESGWIDFHLYVHYSRYNETTDRTQEIVGLFENKRYIKSTNTEKFHKAIDYLNSAISKNNLYCKFELATRQFTVTDRYKMFLKIADETNCLYVKRIICGITENNILDENVYQAMANLWRRVIYHHDANAAYELLSRTPEGVRFNGKQFRSLEHDRDVVIELSTIFDVYCSCGQFHNIYKDPHICNLYMKYETIDDSKEEKKEEDEEEGYECDNETRMAKWKDIVNYLLT